jgi:crotonobetainyl-CoA:carnitine CoA-transferase CaiB-like acyl-CoA transferase
MVTMKVPSRWSESQPEPQRLAPRLGENTAEILTEIGLSESAIAELAAKSVIRR